MKVLSCLFRVLFLAKLVAAHRAGRLKFFGVHARLDNIRAFKADACAKVFTKKNNKLAFTRDADLHAGGLIVQGRQITGTFQKCTVKSFHDDGSNFKVIAACSDGVAVSDVAFDVKITGENTITLSSKEPVPVEMLYVRCSM